MQEGAREAPKKAVAAPETIQTSDIVFSKPQAPLSDKQALCLTRSEFFPEKIIVATYFHPSHRPIARSFMLLNRGKEMRWELFSEVKPPYDTVAYSDRFLPTLGNLINKIFVIEPYCGLTIADLKTRDPNKKARAIEMIHAQKLIVYSDIVFEKPLNCTPEKPVFYLRKSSSSPLCITAEICIGKKLLSSRFAMIKSGSEMSWHFVPDSRPAPSTAVPYEKDFMETFKNLMSAILNSEDFTQRKLSVNDFLATNPYKICAIIDFLKSVHHQARNKLPTPYTSYSEEETPKRQGPK